VETHEPGERVEVIVLRDGDRVSLTVELGDRP
jgi:S1-C subfamily serine protease